MSSVIDLPVETPPRTLADTLRELDIDADRVRWQPYPGTATVEDVIRIEEKEGRLYELVDGILVEKTMGFKESYLAMQIGKEIGIHVDSKNVGAVLGEGGMMQLFPELVRIPDVSYFTWKRLKGQVASEQVPLVAPDLAVEVISPSNTKQEMARKCEEYFKSGAQAVWYFYPVTKTVVVYSSPTETRTYTESDSVPGEPALPGFILNLKKLFVAMDRLVAQ